MRILKENTVALFIDIQEKLFPHILDKEILEQNLTSLSEGLKVLGIPTLVTEQYTKGLGPTIYPLKKLFGDFPCIEKISFSCCDEPRFMGAIMNLEKKTVVICGIEAHVCVLQTVIDLVQLGFQPVVVEDCIASRKLSDKITAINRMRMEGAIITSKESILFELTRFSGSDTFKAISKLVR